MRVSEIVFEDTSAEAQLGGGAEGEPGNLSANLLPVLMFLKKRSEDKELSPKLRMDSLIQLVQNAGDNTFTYEAFVQAAESNEAVKALVKDYNENEIILTSSIEDAGELKKDSEEEGEDPEDAQRVVQQMAKSARAKRES
jgi:hypothetical protein